MISIEVCGEVKETKHVMSDHFSSREKILIQQHCVFLFNTHIHKPQTHTNTLPLYLPVVSLHLPIAPFTFSALLLSRTLLLLPGQPRQTRGSGHSDGAFSFFRFLMLRLKAHTQGHRQKIHHLSLQLLVELGAKTV